MTMSADTLTESTYDEFLRAKAAIAPAVGVDVAADDLSATLMPHQAAIVEWAVRGGRRAIFANFGLGKSIMQLETLRLTLAGHGHGRGLIVCPLGVRQEFMRDARTLLGVELEFVNRSEQVAGDGLYITNYEPVRDGKLDPSLFVATSLDEASVLRSYGSKTFQTFLTLFDRVPYRFVATATPSPNRFKELIHYAGYLGVMDTGQALTRFFQRDSTKANNLTLYPHMEREFWLWLNTWAVFLQSPADLGMDATGYTLPPLDVEYIEVDPDLAAFDQYDRDGQGVLIRGTSMGVVGAAKEKRETIEPRITRLMEIVRAHVGRGEEGQSSGALEGVLPGEPGPADRGPERTGREEGTRGEVGIPSSILGGEPREASGATARAGEAELRSRSGFVSRPEQAEPDSVLRADRSGVRSDAHGTSGPLPAVRQGDVPAGDRPLPRHRGGEGTSLPTVQRRAGSAGGHGGVDTPSALISDQIVIWCELNAEQRLIERRLSDAGITYSSIYGSLPTETVEKRLQEWRDRKTVALVGKPVMLGQGLNLQQANVCVFAGVSHRFNDFIQACHRIQRFGQTRPCVAYIIHAETEREVVATLREKWSQHKELTANMTAVIKEHGLSSTSIADALTRALGIDRITAAGEGWFLANNDTVIETSLMASDSLDMILTSIPFANHYEYTPSYNDFGHTKSNSHFWSQMDYLTPELYRTLKPGRICAIHVKDRILFGNVTGYGFPTVDNFHEETSAHFQKHGFTKVGMITVVTDVVRENNQTYRLGWTENSKDSTKMGVGCPEYVLLFRKPQTDRTKGYADEPVTKDKADYTRARWQVDAHAFWRSSGERLLTTEELAALPVQERSRLFTEQTLRQVYDYASHITIGEQLEGRGALPATFMSLAPGSWHPDVWHDVNRMLTLNSTQSQRAQTMHVCPLQFDIVDRLIVRYTNPGDLVYDPFAGIGTVPLRALKLGRRGAGAELNAGYFLDSVKYLEAQEREHDMPSLFDLEAS